MSATIVAIFIPSDAVWKSYCIVRFSNRRIVLLPNIFFQILCHARRIGVDVFRHELFLFWLFVKNSVCFYSSSAVRFPICVHQLFSLVFFRMFTFLFPILFIPTSFWSPRFHSGAGNTHTTSPSFHFCYQSMFTETAPVLFSRYNRDKLFTRDWQPVNFVYSSHQSSSWDTPYNVYSQLFLYY